jgi:hypothetical protein
LGLLDDKVGASPDIETAFHQGARTWDDLQQGRKKYATLPYLTCLLDIISWYLYIIYDMGMLYN